MAVLRDRPYSGMNFVVDLGTGQVEGPEAGLLEVVFPESSIQVIEYRNGNERANDPLKLLATTHYGNLILRRGVIGSLNWYAWWNACRNGDQNGARNVTVRLLSEDHGEVVLSWRFFRARPVKYQTSPLNAVSSETVIETLELAVERMELE